MDIRYSRGLDEIYLNKWLKDHSVLKAMPCQSELEAVTFAKMWMYYVSKKAGLTAVINDINVGMGMFILMPYKKVMHHAILQMIVAPEHQKQGIGSSLLKNLLHLGKNYLGLEIVFMEFFGPEETLKFFLKHGFKIYAVQKGYVQGPYPDKYLLECPL